ncbi:MAG: gamma-glutamyltransferase [Rhodospirillales bacterium]|nr:gamma-glutamyltransferase [Rhodospirillales bacterium]
MTQDPAGAAAAGHPETAAAAAAILREGGNAYDAVLAGLCAACVCEPVLASLGGGGFLLARTGQDESRLYDFFVQTPRSRHSESEVDFFPILADFGTAQQEFHIGRGSIATPGIVKGMFQIHRELCTMPMARIVEPALELARKGVTINPFQAYIFRIVEKIYSRDEVNGIFSSRKIPETLIGEGEILRNPEFADTLEVLAREGEDLFYRGDIAKTIIDDCRTGGGHLSPEDMENYRVDCRVPLGISFRDTRLLTNPPPSTGGILIAFALEMARQSDLVSVNFGSVEYLVRLAKAMELTNKARVESRLHETDAASAAEVLLNPSFLEMYRKEVLGRPLAQRGTTHISVIDKKGNAASMTVSNGEGSSYVVPGTGIMLNNMLGEEDINPHGFQNWPTDTRMCSMMAPSVLVWPEGKLAALGSGGSNRIRTAILQVLLNLLAFEMSAEDAVNSPRIHVEGDLINLEDGFEPATSSKVASGFSNVKKWEEKNLFFGGVHAVIRDPAKKEFTGAGDPRRGGAIVVA